MNTTDINKLNKNNAINQMTPILFGKKVMLCQKIQGVIQLICAKTGCVWEMTGDEFNSMVREAA